MTVTSSNLPIPSNEWVNLNKEMGIQVGNRMVINNVGAYEVKLAVALSEPLEDTDAYVYLQPRSLPVISEKGEFFTVWAYSQNVKGLLNIEEVD